LAIFESSLLIRYVNLKTRSTTRGSKARSSFATHYVLFSLLEDYIDGGFFNSKNDYAKYNGAKFSELLRRVRTLPFGSKLQNHAFNSRLNDEFKKFFPDCPLQPVIRDYNTKRYWINENLLKITTGTKTINIAKVLIEIIDAYIKTKEDAFKAFVATCKKMQTVSSGNPKEIQGYVRSLLQPNVDARIFEIVSYAVLKQHYAGTPIYWGWSLEKIKKDYLKLFKTGRTNANDGGIDFVMKPVGRFFQVTETTDVKKYFLDIDKIQRFPLTFVIKTDDSVDKLRKDIKTKAAKVYPVEKIVQRYMDCIEEIINIPKLLEYLDNAVINGKIAEVFQEVIAQSEVEFNFNIDE
jgi:hypothetical protein